MVEQVTTTTTSTDGGDGGDAATTAAVGAGALAGAAVAEAGTAKDQATVAGTQAADAAAAAEQARQEAAAAKMEAMSTREMVDDMVRREYARTLAADQVAPTAPAGPTVVEGGPGGGEASGDQPPKSLAKRVKKDKKTLKERWSGR